MLRQAALTLIAWLCLACVSEAQVPAGHFADISTATGRVVDDPGLLPATDRAALTASLAKLQAGTTGQLVVVILNSLQGTRIDATHKGRQRRRSHSSTRLSLIRQNASNSWKAPEPHPNHLRVTP